jgi:hypothetical protein
VAVAVILSYALHSLRRVFERSFNHRNVARIERARTRRAAFSARVGVGLGYLVSNG